jgi:hypothetical protein
VRQAASNAVPTRDAQSNDASASRSMLLQRLVGNQALGIATGQRGINSQTVSHFADQVQRRIQPGSAGQPGASQRKGDIFFRRSPAPQVSAGAGGIQRFKDKAKDKDEVTEAVVNTASLDTLKEWLAREAPVTDDWEAVADDILVPSGTIRKLITDRVKQLEADAAEKARLEAAAKKQEALDSAKREKLAALGVTEDEHKAVLGFTSDEAMITKAAENCKKKQWSLLEVLDQTKGYSEELKGIVIGMLAKGDVTIQKAIVDLCSNWDNLNNRETIDVDILLSLLKANAVFSEGGGHSQHKTKVTGTKNLAIPFYTASNPKRRIVPEFHTHLQSDGVVKKPSFKSQKGKMAVGAGARRDLSQAEANALLKALGYK